MIVTMDSKLKKLEAEIQQLKTELSIALEYYAKVKEFLSELTQLTRKSSELEISKPTTLLSTTSSNTKPKSKIDEMMDKCIDLIFKDYRTQGQG
jgi:predicted ribosome quality control (RQC) complex YloA/Tae2 family protein